MQVELPTVGYAGGPTRVWRGFRAHWVYLLAEEVLEHMVDLEAELKAYEEIMRPLVEEMQTIPIFIGMSMMPQTRWG